MKIIITAGGTGGHIYPAIAILEKIKELEPDSEILYIGTTNRMEKDMIPALGIKYIGIEMYGINKSIKNDIKVLYLVTKNIKYCKKIMKEFKPDAVLGIGGYVTYPVIKAASMLKIPTFIHEQNSIPGKSNLRLARIATKIGISFKSSEHFFDEKKVVYTGNPCSERALTIEKVSRTKYGLHKNKKFILMVQGSSGSGAMNKKMIEFLSSIDNEDYEVLYITGTTYYEEFSKNIFSKNVYIEPYIDNLAGLMKDADIVVSRAGASSLSEIIALKKISIIVPSPYVANNHQFFNALDVANNKACVMIEDDAFNGEVLKNQIRRILDDKEMQINMQLNLAKMSKNDSSTVIYNTIKDMIK